MPGNYYTFRAGVVIVRYTWSGALSYRDLMAEGQTVLHPEKVRLLNYRVPYTYFPVAAIALCQSYILHIRIVIHPVGHKRLPQQTAGVYIAYSRGLFFAYK